MEAEIFRLLLGTEVTTSRVVAVRVEHCAPVWDGRNTRKVRKVGKICEDISDHVGRLAFLVFGSILLILWALL